MDSSAYRDLKTSRGYTYHYYASAPLGDKPTLLLLHGFPTTSLDWVFVVASFQKEGYGIIAPDLLGYAGTDKPTDPAEYRMKLMTADIVEILDAENAKKIVSIAHDWGCGLNSRLANYHSERFEAFAFFAIPYFPPIISGKFDIDVLNVASKEKLGYTHLGYFKFFETERAAKIMEEHYDSLESLAFAKDHLLMRDNFCVDGALEKWLLSDKTTETVSYISDEAWAANFSILLKGGFSAPLCWYKAFLQNLTPKDDAGKYCRIYFTLIHSYPVFFGAALKDPTGPSEQSKDVMKMFARKLTVVDFDTEHWVLFAAPEKVNAELEKWIKSLGL
ncbi:alpha/beta-hydrolase [Phellopilus nigrolimitatus]|nr:alpha/beta-hydrolase [Phellopilus nigrolimitatus]